MTITFPVTGMTCKGCVAKVKGELLKDPDVTAAEVTLEPQQAVISMNRKLSAEHFQKLLGYTSHYHILESAATPIPDATDKSWFATYKPLLLIFAFITGVSLIGSIDAGSIHAMSFMRYFMAGFFLVFSFFKLLDIKGFASSYAMYDIVAMRWNAYGMIYPFLELALGVSYLINFNSKYTNIATLVIMSVSSVGVIESVLNKKKIQCACLGAVFNLPMSTLTIVEDLLMMVMAAIGLWIS